ncbi:MAG: glycerol-3-phosphate 1-O-acyltransferase PlsY [Erysipelothrix sp.]|nr:glycerol-3-phosphate 1-O-acyltransferase PlsY [Erysipelothrix sp.]
MSMQKILFYLLASIAAYLFGSIPWSLVIGKVFYQTDIREHGSGNLGGTNAGRILGAKAGSFVIALDILKSFIIVTILSSIDQTLAILCGMFASIGHCFPIFANFKGGKAVATNAGYILAISIFITKNPLYQAAIPVLVFLVMLFAFKMVSLASIVALTSASIISFFQPNLLVSIGITLLSAFSIYRHKDNIKRIINKEERKVGFLSK